MEGNISITVSEYKKELECEKKSCYYIYNHFGLVINLGPTEWAGSLSADFFPLFIDIIVSEIIMDEKNERFCR